MENKKSFVSTPPSEEPEVLEKEEKKPSKHGEMRQLPPSPKVEEDGKDFYRLCTDDCFRTRTLRKLEKDFNFEVGHQHKFGKFDEYFVQGDKMYFIKTHIKTLKDNDAEEVAKDMKKKSFRDLIDSISTKIGYHIINQTAISSATMFLILNEQDNGYPKLISETDTFFECEWSGDRNVIKESDMSIHLLNKIEAVWKDLEINPYLYNCEDLLYINSHGQVVCNSVLHASYNPSFKHGVLIGNTFFVFKSVTLTQELTDLINEWGPLEANDPDKFEIKKI